jgi:hypothetical protein
VSKAAKSVQMLVTCFLCVTMVAAEQPFPVVSTVDVSSIAGRPVALDSQGKLLPWPMPGPIQPAEAALLFLLLRF